MIRLGTPSSPYGNEKGMINHRSSAALSRRRRTARLTLVKHSSLPGCTSKKRVTLKGKGGPRRLPSYPRYRSLISSPCPSTFALRSVQNTLEAWNDLMSCFRRGSQWMMGSLHRLSYRKWKISILNRWWRCRGRLGLKLWRMESLEGD